MNIYATSGYHVWSHFSIFDTDNHIYTSVTEDFTQNKYIYKKNH